MQSLALRRRCHLAPAAVIGALFSLLVLGLSIGAVAAEKPVLLYSRYYNAAGEARYLPDGTYREVLRLLEAHFRVRVSSNVPTAKLLRDVQVVLIANPSDRAVDGHPAPHHFGPSDIGVWRAFVEGGGGLILMGNQENHNLEVEDSNRLLRHFGLQFTNLYTDAKQLVLPADNPIFGGLRWAYYTGNLVETDRSHSAHARALIQNDLTQKPIKGTRDTPGALLAVAEPGRGRVAVVTDAGWITEDALSSRGIGGVAIRDHDNFEIFRRLAHWVGEKKAP